jgi:hypothetical protein
MRIGVVGGKTPVHRRRHKDRVTIAVRQRMADRMSDVGTRSANVLARKSRKALDGSRPSPP